MGPNCKMTPNDAEFDAELQKSFSLCRAGSGCCVVFVGCVEVRCWRGPAARQPVISGQQLRRKRRSGGIPAQRSVQTRKAGGSGIRRERAPPGRTDRRLHGGQSDVKRSYYNGPNPRPHCEACGPALQTHPSAARFPVATRIIAMTNGCCSM